MSAIDRVTSIGYEGKTLDDLVSSLRLSNVTVLVDVRLNAISRKRGFSKTALRGRLEEEGIAYVHLKELGNQKDNRAGYSEIGTASARQARSSFRAVLDSSAATEALEYVLKMAAHNKVALFCYEHDVSHCHREQVLEKLHHHARELVEAS